MRLRLYCKFSAFCQEIHFANFFPKLTSKLTVPIFFFFFFFGQVKIFSARFWYHLPDEKVVKKVNFDPCVAKIFVVMIQTNCWVTSNLAYNRKPDILRDVCSNVHQLWSRITCFVSPADLHRRTYCIKINWIRKFREVLLE